MNAGRRLLRVNCFGRKIFWLPLNFTAISIVQWKPEIGNGLRSYSQLGYTGCITPSQSRQIGFFIGKLPTQVGYCYRSRGIGPAKNKHYLQLLPIKNETKSESYSENKHADFLMFITLESLEETCQSNLFLFFQEDGPQTVHILSWWPEYHLLNKKT